MNNKPPETEKMQHALRLLRRACDESEQGRHKWKFAMESLGDLLAGMRRHNRISGARMAKAMGISPSYLSLLEAGKRDWTEDIIWKWDWAMEDLYANHIRLNNTNEMADAYT